MRRFLPSFALFLCLVLVFASPAAGQQLTGAVRGTVTDNEGNPLPGVSVTASAVELMGTQSSITNENGVFRFPALPPGNYTLKVELPGFKTLERGGVAVRVGMIITIDINLEASAIAEEVTVVGTSPVVDVASTKIAVVMDRELLKNIPMARDLYDIVNSAPGAISEGQTYRRTSSIHGATVRSNTYAFDGVNMNDPVVMYPLTNINFDVMDEVEMITGAQPASVGYTDGAYINVVTRSGGNRFSGGLIFYYTAKALNQQLWTDDQLKSMGVVRAAVDKLNYDASATLGGPIVKDRLWFFMNGRLIKREQITDFRGPWTDFFGNTHDPYNWIHEEKMGFAKLTGQLSSKFKVMGQFNYVDIYRPMYEEPGAYTTFEATRMWDHEKGLTFNGQLNYILDQNTFLDLRAGYVKRDFPLPLQTGQEDLPYIDDVGDAYGALTTARFNEYYLRTRFQTGLYFTRFQDNLMGGSHEFKGGVEIENAYGDWDWYRTDNLLWYTDHRRPNPYYRYATYGYTAFYICGQEKGSTKIMDKARRIGAYLQDQATLFNRLTLNIGIRYDRSWGWKPAVTKQQAAPLSYWIGENIVRPYVIANYPEQFPEGINPFGEATSPAWMDIITWNSWSPRFGLTYDLFGDGTTALKFSFSQYTEYLMLQYFSTLHPFYPQSIAFNWWDTNADNYPNIGDTFGIRGAPDFRGFDIEFSKNKIDPGAKSPLSTEITAGIQREISKNFFLGFNFIYKKKKNILDDSQYSVDDGQYWFNLGQPLADANYVPYTTTIPALDNYDAEDVTFYVRRNSSPPIFYRFHNVPDLFRKYQAFELLFNKRMSNGWQVNGSIVLSKATGNIGGWYDQSWGWTGGGDSPNNYVNATGRINIDRPLQIKLMGTAVLPWKFLLSGLYMYQSGAPWTRGSYILPDEAFCTENDLYYDYYWVNIEPEGSHRYRDTNQLDIRLEKEFKLGSWATLGAYMDVINLLGFSGVNIGVEDTYIWEPDAEGAGQPGTRTTEGTYKIISSAYGIRTIRFTVRFSFF